LWILNEVMICPSLLGEVEIGQNRPNSNPWFVNSRPKMPAFTTLAFREPFCTRFGRSILRWNRQKGNAFFHPANALNSKRISGQKGNPKVFNAPEDGSR